VIDLHCHFLPGVDDGAPNLETALDLARAAVQNGIRTSVLTPHLYPGRWENHRSVSEPTFALFKQALQDSNIALDIRLGAEVHLLPESLALIDASEIPFLGKWAGNSVMLLEFPDGQIPVGAMMAVKYCLKRGIVPMIAHPERNKDVMRNVKKILPFVQEGCLLQLTAASVVGRFGASAHETAMRLLDEGVVTVVATDSHNMAYRPPILAEAKLALANRFGADVAVRMVDLNPSAIVDG
jgi:protein-tyrosine phosphatase